MELVRVDDIDVACDFHGNGPAVIMIMGLTANRHWWHPELINRLSGGLRLVAFDNRGAGNTPRGGHLITISQYARDTAGLMNALGIERAHVIGASMGGMIAQQLALDFPEKVSSLVLCCTSTGGPNASLPRPYAVRMLASRAADPETQARRSITLLYPEEYLAGHPEVIEEFVSMVTIAPMSRLNANRQLLAAARFSSFHRLNRIRVPTLVMAGSEDIVLPARNSRLLAERIPGARLVEYPGAGHGFLGQCATEASGTMLGFLLDGAAGKESA